MEKDSELLFDWTEPEKIERSATRSLRIRGLTILPFILLFTVILLFGEAVFPFIDPDPNDAPAPYDFSTPIVLGLAYIFLFKLLPKTIRLFGLNLSLIRPKRFRVSPKDITCSLRLLRLSEDWKVRTDNITAYSLSQHDILPEIKVLTVHSGKNRKNSLTLPENDTAGAIIDFFASSFTELKNKETVLETQLSKRQYLFLFVFMNLYALIATIIMYYSPLTSPIFVPALISLVILGPGTIGLLILLKKRIFRSCNASYWAYAFFLNISVASLMLLFGYIYLFFVFR